MRLSVLDTDPGFEAYRQIQESGQTVRIFLDDVAQTDVLTADDEAGWITRYLKTGPTQFVIKDEACVTETVHGKVLIVVATKSSGVN